MPYDAKWLNALHTTPALVSWKLRWVVLVFLLMTGVGFRTIVAGMTADERAQAVNAFNSKDSGVVVLVTSFASGGRRAQRP